ncbi:MAG TPA: BTAD domain-containing putative transcriptional regulator [Modestobacter sp.]|jgi:DNA-binding SARP family transcriptional activator|nr:BTAD domain-containing putative transcriptional regulator [Modestobacter sp.]
MDPASGARVALLDGFALELDGSRSCPATDDLPHGVQRLVAHLSLAGHPTRGTIAGQLWPDVPEVHAHGSLRSALWRLHKVVPGLVETSRSALGLAAGVRVDVRELTAWAAGVLDPTAGPEGLRAAGAALEGELLPGWYDDWVLLERERLRQLRMHALEMLAERLVRAGRYGEAIQVAFTAVRDEPLRESAHRVLIRAHLAEGNVAEALREYDTFREMLAEELGVRPTAQMRDLVLTADRARQGMGGRPRPA